MNNASYRDGVLNEAIPCEVVLSEHKIYIYFKDQAHDMLIWDLRALDSCVRHGFDLKIVKEKVPGQSLECVGEIAKIIFDAYSNPVTEIPLGRPRKVVSFFVLGLIAFLTLLILAYIYLLPWIAGKAVNLVSEDLEIKLGNNLSEVYLKEGHLNDSASFYADKFVQQLNLHTKYPIHIYVMESEEINAFAVPGGNIFVYSGLIEKMNAYEELVALMGHEATHVIKRHSLKSILSSAASSVLIGYFFGDGSGLSAWAISKADEFKQLDYSRDLETEADQNGFQLMIQNKVSPKGMSDLLKVLQKESAEMPGMMKYLSTHPETEERINTIASEPLINKTFPANENLVKDFDKIKAQL